MRVEATARCAGRFLVIQAVIGSDGTHSILCHSLSMRPNDTPIGGPLERVFAATHRPLKAL